MSIPLAQHLANQLAVHTPTAQGIAVALSGGADSWALTLLAHAYAETHGLNFIALTVDHRLRPESAAEAAGVAAECAKRGIPHAILVWHHDEVTTRKQERARQARYDLLGDYCAAHSFTHLLTAHHADDQAETVLLRFARGSGTKGLAGMAAIRLLANGVTLVRPLLEIPKAELLAYIRAAGVPIVEDSSNSDPAYARARLRDARGVLAREGLTTATLLKTAATARGEDEALNYAMQRLILDHATFSPYGGVGLPQEPFAVAAPLLRRYAWLTIWQHVTRSPGYAPAPDAIDAACEKLGGDQLVRRTLGGMLQTRNKTGLTFVRETSAIQLLNVPPQSEAIYDKRYQIVNGSDQTLTIMPTHGSPSHRQVVPWLQDATIDPLDWHGRPAALWAGTSETFSVDPHAGGPILPLRIVARGMTPVDDARVYAYLLCSARIVS